MSDTEGEAARHKAVRIQVNAWVDVGVARLVEALNACPDVVTLDSCQGGDEGPTYVLFTTPDPADLLTLVPRMADHLAQVPECRATISLDWWCGAEIPTGRITCPPSDVDAVGAHLQTGFFLPPVPERERGGLS